MATFKLKADLPQETRHEIDRVQAIPSGQRNDVEAAFLAGIDSDYFYNEVIERNADNLITKAKGRTIPDGLSGFSIGASFIKENATVGEPALFENRGDDTTSDFIMVGNINTEGAPDATVQATLTTALTGSDNDLDFTAVPLGVLGNEITIEYLDPEDVDQSLAIIVTGNAIVVSLATDSNGDITTTAGDIITAIEADATASALVTLDNHSTDDGTGVVIAMAATALADGVDATGMGYAHTGAVCVDYDTPGIYINTGTTKGVPTWTLYPAA